MILLQIAITQLQSASDGLFFLFIAFCVVAVIINIAKLVNRKQKNTTEPFSTTTNTKSTTSIGKYGYTNEKGETLFDDVKPTNEEAEYRIIGVNHRNLSKNDIGYSDNFCLNAADDNKLDKYAVEIYNGRGHLVGYIEQDFNKFWHKLLKKANPSNPVMQCRGFIGQFINNDNELKFYGRVYLPEIDEQDPDYNKIMNE